MLEERDLRNACGIQTETAFPEALNAYRTTLNVCGSLLAHTAGRDANSLQQIAMVLLTHSHNAAIASLNLLCEGYPRFALHLARFMREGHIAFRWARNNPDSAAQHFANYKSRSDWPRGTWPAVGDMAQQLGTSLRQSTVYQQFQGVYRDTHNQLFSHAISDWAVEAVLGDFSEQGWSPSLGPVFEERLISDGFRHLMPLLAWHLVDTADFSEWFGSMDDDLRRGVEAALEVTSRWIEANPPVVAQPPR